MKRKRIIIVDADLVQHRAAVVGQTEYSFDPGSPLVEVNYQQAIDVAKQQLDDIYAELRGDRMILAFTSGRDDNWRRCMLPSYKMNRTTEKSQLFEEIREWFEENYECRSIHGLEGDDICGILATAPRSPKEVRFVVSGDKDMRTIPGKHYNPMTGEKFVVEPHEACRYHMLQTLMGDQVDGYKGCPGLGAIGAEKILKNLKPTYEDIWPAVIKAYQRANQDEADALIQARVARILRFGEFSFITGDVSLWQPTPSPVTTT